MFQDAVPNYPLTGLLNAPIMNQPDIRRRRKPRHNGTEYGTMVLSKYVGAVVKRKEDPRLITGSSTYVDDIRIPGTLHVSGLHGTLFTELAIDSLDLRTADGKPFITTGPIRLTYDPRDLLAECVPLVVRLTGLASCRIGRDGRDDQRPPRSVEDRRLRSSTVTWAAVGSA